MDFLGAEILGPAQGDQHMVSQPLELLQASIATILEFPNARMLQFKAKNNDNHEKLLERRHTALMSALQAIDHEYSNERWDNGDPRDPHPWNIQVARDADNQIRIYCGDPQTHVLLLRALNVHNPATESPKVITTTALYEFRKQIARELELPEPIVRRNPTELGFVIFLERNNRRSHATLVQNLFPGGRLTSVPVGLRTRKVANRVKNLPLGFAQEFLRCVALGHI